MHSIQIINLSENFRLEPRGWSFAPFTDPERIGQIDIDWTSFHTVSIKNLGEGILYLVAFRSPARNVTDPEVLPSIIIE